MANTANKSAAALLRHFTDIEQDLGEIILALKAQHLALCERFPDFEDIYRRKTKDKEYLKVKKDYENRIAQARKAHRKMLQEQN